MPRELAWPEVTTFLGRHKEVSDQVAIVDQGGYVAMPLAYPGHGVAVRDDVWSYVLVWRDAGKRWHYIDLSDRPDFAKEVNKPEYVSPGGSFLENLGVNTTDTLTEITTIVKWTAVAFIAILLVSQAVRFGR